MAKLKRRSHSALLSLLSISGFVVVFAGMQIYNSSLKAEATIVVTKNPLQKGDMITKEDLQLTTVPPEIINQNMLTLPDDIIGKYTTRDVDSNEILLASFIADDLTKRVADKVRGVGLPIVTNQLLSVNGEIKADDFIHITIVSRNSNDGNYSANQTLSDLPDKVQLLEPPALAAVRVVEVIDGSGLQVDQKVDALRDAHGKIPLEENKPQPTMLILDVNQIQRALLLQGQQIGQLQISILPEATQERLRKEVLGIDASTGKADNINKEDATLSEEHLTPEEIEKRKQELAAQGIDTSGITGTNLDPGKNDYESQDEINKIAEAEFEEALKQEAERTGKSIEQVRADYEKAKQEAKAKEEASNVHNNQQENTGANGTYVPNTNNGESASN